jgi:fumarate hydratase class I
VGIIREADFVQSIADALQFISYYHSPDFIAHLADAYERERSHAARDAIAQILTNSRLCAEGHRPICQDTGIVNAFLRVGMDVRWDTDKALTELVDEGVRRAYTHPENPLRPSVVADPLFDRTNTGDNTPAVTHVEIVPGGTVEVTIAAKGGGSEHKASFAVLNPSDSLVDWVLRTVPTLGAGWCPPGLLGIGVGGTAERAMLLAKQSLFEPLDMHQLLTRGPASKLDALRIELYQKVNALGIGAQGLGGVTTILDVKIRVHPTHVASKPVAMIPNCAATRHVHFVLDGSGAVTFEPPSLDAWPAISWVAGPQSRRVDLGSLTREEVASWRAGETLLLTGRLLTGRDAAHHQIAELLAGGKGLPAGVDFTNRVIYYVGPVRPVGQEVVGPAGPTTATRMDKFTAMMLEKTGLLAMIGKAERGAETIDLIRAHGSAYLIAVGGAAYLVSRAIRQARVVAFPELGMEAIFELEVVDMPVTVAVDSTGTSLHETGPAFWRGQLRSPQPGIAIEATPTPRSHSRR